MFWGFFAGWSVPAQTAIAATLLAALGWPIKAAVARFQRGSQSDQSHDLHKIIAGQHTADGQEIDQLRRLLDRGRRRENGWATGCELLLIAMPQQLTPEQVAIVARAREIFEATYLSLSGEGGGGR